MKNSFPEYYGAFIINSGKVGTKNKMKKKRNSNLKASAKLNDIFR